MSVINYDWDEIEDNIDEEYDSSGSSTAEYTTTPTHDVTLLSQRRGEQNTYYHYNGQGDTSHLSNDDGSIADEYIYSAFGNQVVTVGNTINHYQFKSADRYYTNLDIPEIYVRTRNYQSILGRWNSLDVVIMNSEYKYGNNNPINVRYLAGFRVIVSDQRAHILTSRPDSWDEDMDSQTKEEPKVDDGLPDAIDKDKPSGVNPKGTNGCTTVFHPKLRDLKKSPMNCPKDDKWVLLSDAVTVKTTGKAADYIWHCVKCSIQLCEECPKKIICRLNRFMHDRGGILLVANRCLCVDPTGRKKEEDSGTPEK